MTAAPQRSCRRRRAFARRILHGSVAVVLLASGWGLGHPNQDLAPHDLAQSWNWRSSTLVLLLGLAVSYGRGVQVVWNRAGVGALVSPGRVLAFAGGLLGLFVAFVSPVDALGGVLFSGHMTQHMLLVIVAAPLLVLGAPLLPLLWALPRHARRTTGRVWRRARSLRALLHGLMHPLVAGALYALVLWAWHAPALYQAALRNETIHEVQHLSFLSSALLLWWTVLQPLGRRRLHQGLTVVLLFFTMLQSAALSAILSFSSRALYPAYADSVERWGLTLIEDQQIAGSIMWVTGNFVLVVALVIVLLSWLRIFDADPATP